jgi:hypothetical protein
MLLLGYSNIMQICGIACRLLFLHPIPPRMRQTFRFMFLQLKGGLYPGDFYISCQLIGTLMLSLPIFEILVGSPYAELN